MPGLRSQAHTLRQFAFSESGQSLVLALIVMSALTISIGALISFTTGNETQFSRDRESSRAFHVAEAGLNNALSVLANADDNDVQAVGAVMGPYALSLDGASGTYSMTKYAKADPECTHDGSPSNCWVISGSATSPNGRITRTLQEVAYWKTASTPQEDIFNFGLVVDNQGAACVATHGTVPMTIKDVWISGDFCPAGDVGLQPPIAHTGSVYIGGVYQGRNNTNIGTSSLPYRTANIVGGCVKQNSPEICSDSANSNVYADDPPAVDPSSLSIPDIDAKDTYDSGNWNTPTCTGGGSFTFDSDSTQNGTTPTTTLMPSGSTFDCTVHNDNGDIVGHLAWNSSTNQLSISGTVWIDGNVNLSNSGTYVKDNVVTGANGGTIFVNGTVSGASNITVCGPAGSAVASGSGCPTTWNPDLGTLGIVVVNPLNASTGFSRTGNGELDITLLVNQGYADTGGTTVMGPVLADTATIGGNGGSIVPTAPPTGFPSATTTQATWVVQPGSWKQTR
jgi:Tfp pilus assembly protein PilX